MMRAAWLNGRLASGQNEIDMVNWLRRQAADRREDRFAGPSRWYVCVVRPGSEIAIALDMMARQGRGGRIRAFVPRERIVEKRGNGCGKRMVRRISFPGYVFVELAPADLCFEAVTTFDGVSHLLPSTERPACVERAAILELQRIGRFRPHRKTRMPSLLAVGDRIFIRKGSFADFRGTVITPDDGNGRLKVEVELFGRAVALMLGLDQVKKLR